MHDRSFLSGAASRGLIPVTVALPGHWSVICASFIRQLVRLDAHELPASVALERYGLLFARTARGRRPRSSGIAGTGQASRAAGASVAARERSRSRESTDRRVVGRDAAADGRQDRSQLRLVASQGARGRAGATADKGFGLLLRSGRIDARP